MSQINAPKGTFDLWSPKVELYQRAESAARRIFARHGFCEIRTPVFESTELFARGVGAGSDLVNKEMYTFNDRGDRSLTLRPEGTAPVMRALIENRLADKPFHQRVYYMGPMFRYERPQKGRYRQFHQIGVEAVGDVPPELEAEIIAMLFAFLDELGFTGLGLQVNSIGDKACLPAYLEALRAFVKSRWDELDEECHQRFERNVLRCLDCKNPGCKTVYEHAPKLAEVLCVDCRGHHDRFKASLRDFGIAFMENPNLVRGLDYYRRTAFEVTAAGLGSQDALLGGGRYDDLIKELGGPALPGFGFGIGLDRLVLAMEHANPSPSSPAPVCALLFDPDDAAKAGAYSLADALRKAEITVFLSPKPGPFGLQFKWAGKLFADTELLKARNQTPFALVVGTKEIATRIVTVKNMTSGEQTEVKQDELIATLKKSS